MKRYEARSVRWAGVAEQDGWRIKQYEITRPGAEHEAHRFTAGLPLVFRALPTPAATAARPGVAFLIAHQGDGADYLIVAWWDRENELPLRVFVRSQKDGSWRAAAGSESVCVWDLEVIWRERQAYVATVLAGDTPHAVEAYLRLEVPT